ncbi:MAG: hypothetical protein WAM75_20100, partial [Xanthobacteraceae bacterium]
MSEYYDDSNIRRYTPVLQRMIILLAVIIAVPVVMWTITTVVRTYVAAPKAPSFQRLTDTQPTDTVSDASPAAPAAATPAVQAAAAPTPQLADAQAAATQARTALLDINKPANTPSQSVAPTAAPAPVAVAAPAVARNAPAPVIATPPPPIANAAATMPPASAPHASMAPASMVLASTASASAANGAAATTVAGPSSPSGMAW